MASTCGRLKKRPEFLRVANHGSRSVMRGLVLQSAQRHGEDDDEPRIGFTVSKKVGNAVRRNRARRRLKAIADMLAPELAKAGCDYVIVGRYSAADRPFEKLVSDMRRAFLDPNPQRGRR
ncbi:ribonuclease P protein component [Alphaproteobacteria bacterium HT1-32]|nr:ribonuclease P protein component [Alphaproteobacteria bacterium HT1-32]|tara:strand:+ start:16064 stop:16423 length:360 start_codon:yes stop_codon:yes gene_type:complete